MDEKLFLDLLFITAFGAILYHNAIKLLDSYRRKTKR